MLYGGEQPLLVVPEIITGYERIKALKKDLHRNITDLLALAPINDPFYAGSPASREKAEWFLALWQQFGFTSGVHLRRIHYRLVSVDVPYKKADGLPSQKWRQSLTQCYHADQSLIWPRSVSPTGSLIVNGTTWSR